MSNSDRGDDPGPAPSAPPPLELEVRGVRPVPKGAVSAFVVPGKSGKRARAVVVQGGTKAKRSALAEWSSAIQDAALVAMGARELEVARFVGAPVEVDIEFRLARPKAHYGTGKNAGVLKADAPPYPLGTPDIDKLTRAVLDALIGVAFDDDSRVVDLRARKVYASPEGARIRVAFARERGTILAIVPSCDPLVLRADRALTASELRLLEANELGTLTAAALQSDADRFAAAHGLPSPTVKIETAAAALREGENSYRERVLGQPVPTPAEKARAQTNRIRAIVDGSPMAAELEAFGKKRTHVAERHVPPQSIDDLPIATDKPKREYEDELDIAIAANDRGVLARRLLEAPAGSSEERRCLAALAGIPTVRQPDEDDFGGPDL